MSKGTQLRGGCIGACSRYAFCDQKVSYFWSDGRPTESWPKRGSQKLACHFKPKQLKLAFMIGSPHESLLLQRGSRGKGAAAPFPCTPNPRSTQAFAPLRTFSVDDAEHFLHNHHASVASLRLLFTFAPERRSASLRNRCSPSPECPQIALVGLGLPSAKYPWAKSRRPICPVPSVSSWMSPPGISSDVKPRRRAGNRDRAMRVIL
jgi:hypothetical protein